MNTDDPNDLDNPRRRILRDDSGNVVVRPRRGPSGLVVACAVLALAVVALAWYSYPRFRQQDASLSQTRAELRDRVREWGEKTKDAFNRTEAKLNAEIHSRTQSTDALKDRVASLEASRAADQSQLAQLKQELNDLAPEAALPNVAADQTGDDDSAGVPQPVEKISFEASKDRQNQLTDGIALFVSGTDMTRRSVSGWVWLANERRSIPLRQQNALEPVIFYGAGDGQKRELVITHVDPNSVSGYLLLPKDSQQGPVNRAATGGRSGAE